MQKHSIRQRIQRKERWCCKMEKKLAVIVDNKEITTEVTNTEMCSSACDVAMETCSSECHDTWRKSWTIISYQEIDGNYNPYRPRRMRHIATKGEVVKILDFTHFSRVFKFNKTSEIGRKKEIFHEIKVSVVMELV